MCTQNKIFGHSKDTETTGVSVLLSLDNTRFHKIVKRNY